MTVTALQVVTEELRHWIVAQAEAGCKPEDVLAAMVQSGWQEEVAIAAMERTLSEGLAQRQAEAQSGGAMAVKPANTLLGPSAVVPEPSMERTSPVLNGDGRPVQLLSSMQLPRVHVFGQLLSDAECEGLVELARPRLMRSETVDNATGGSEINVARTSDGMFFERGESPLIRTIEERIAALVRWPVSHGEGLQILRYRPSAEYKPHHDYFDLKHPGSAKILERGGQRVATLVMYLNAPEAGGATTFPDVGLEVAPVRGNAVFFTYDRAHVATRTLHGGAPVTAGEKWVATKWLREGVFT